MIPSVRDWAYQQYKALETRDHRLRYLFFEITRRCNLNCRHCGSDCSRELSMQELSLETWESLMDYVKVLWDPFIVITGGEPLVREDLLELAKALKTRNLKWGMVTNGWALTEARLNSLLDQGLSSLTISLDGPQEAHTYIRRHPQSFSRALEACRLMGRSTLEFKDAVTCVHPGNLHRLEETADILLDAGVTSWRLFRIFPKGAAAKDAALILDFDQSRGLVEWIASHRKSYLRKGLDVSFSCEGFLPPALDREVRSEPFFCRAGVSIASVLSDGTVTGCNNNGPQFYQGHIAQDTLENLWETRFQEYRNREWMRTGICSDCYHWRSCKGSSIHLKEKNSPGPGFCYLTPQEREGLRETAVPPNP